MQSRIPREKNGRVPEARTRDGINRRDLLRGSLATTILLGAGVSSVAYPRQESFNAGPTVPESHSGTVAGSVESLNACTETRLYGMLGPGPNPVLDPASLLSEFSHDIRVRLFTMSWQLYEPQDGQFDDTFAQNMHTALQTYKNAGMMVNLEFGLHLVPDWVFDLPNSQFRDQFGNTSRPALVILNGANAVFNAEVRARQERYVRKVFEEFGSEFFAVRIGWGPTGEVGYPNPKQDNGYWAFDPIAQGTQAGLPPGMVPCPVPGWTPGTPTPNHDSARQFANWYMDSLRRYISWQLELVGSLSPSSLKEIMFPGWGLRPGQLDEAIAVDLNGTTIAEQTFSTRVGNDIARIAQDVEHNGVVLNTSAIDQSTQAGTPFGDDTSSDMQNWTPGHYVSSVAHSLGLETWSENVGNNSFQDMIRSFDRVHQFGVSTLIWANVQQLTSGDPSLASIDQYEETIAEYNQWDLSRSDGLNTLYLNTADKRLRFTSGDAKGYVLDTGVLDDAGMRVEPGVVMGNLQTANVRARYVVPRNGDPNVDVSDLMTGADYHLNSGGFDFLGSPALCDAG